MKQAREITVFCYGNSADLRTWSNVPCLLTQALEQEGCKVNRVDLSAHRSWASFYEKTVVALYRFFGHRDSTYCWNRSLFRTWTVNRVIRRAVRQFPGTTIFLSFAFGWDVQRFTKAPCVMVGDWTYAYYIENRLGRAPDAWEGAAVRRERAAIERTAAAAVLFADSAAAMQTTYQNDAIRFLGAYINAVQQPQETLPTTKYESNLLLFVGHKGYLAGAKALLQAAALLRQAGVPAEVCCIGLEKEDFSAEEAALPWLDCRGYLNKGDEAECGAYYKLLETARVCVNTTPGWSAMSSVMEEMYFYCPIVTQPNDNFVRVFGAEAVFGAYCGNEPQEIAAELRRIFALPAAEYAAMCTAAHEKVAGCTWQRWAQKLLRLADEVRALPKEAEDVNKEAQG